MGKRFRRFLPVLLILVTSFANLHSQEKSDPALLTLERGRLDDPQCHVPLSRPL